MAIKPRARVMGGGLRMRKPKAPAPSTQYAEGAAHATLLAHGYKFQGVKRNEHIYHHSSGKHAVALDDAGGWHHTQYRHGVGDATGNRKVGQGDDKLAAHLRVIHGASQHAEAEDHFHSTLLKHGYAYFGQHGNTRHYSHQDQYQIQVHKPSGQWTIHGRQKGVPNNYYATGDGHTSLGYHLQKLHKTSQHAEPEGGHFHAPGSETFKVLGNHGFAKLADGKGKFHSHWINHGTGEHVSLRHDGTWHHTHEDHGTKMGLGFETLHNHLKSTR